MPTEIRIRPKCDETGGEPLFDMDRPLTHISNGSVMTIATLDKGMDSGRGSAAFCFELPDGQQVLFESSLRSFFVAANFLSKHHPAEAREAGLIP